VSFRTHHSLAGYARAAVDLKARMHEHTQSPGFGRYIDAFLQSRLGGVEEGRPGVGQRVHDAVAQAAGAVWRVGEPFVLAPAMTAIVAAAAEALDLTGEVLTDQLAPCDWGVLFLPEPVYHRTTDGNLSSIAAITWAPVSSGNHRCWLICRWADHHDPDDPHAARIRAAIATHPDLSPAMGPYVLTDLDLLPIAEPVPARADASPVDQADLDWETSPEGRYVIAERDTATKAGTALAYAFWRIAAQPLATVTRPPLDRTARRRAARAGVNHNSRVVMLRRTAHTGELDQALPRWRYRVRFMVRGHWRRLHDEHGSPYRIWIHSFIKGPDGAPLLHGERVAVLAR
jgi:hypothetical protein